MIRRRALLVAAAAAGALAALRNVQGGTAPRTANPFGPLRPDRQRILDLPDGFTYQVIARTGEVMDDGLRVPARPDGMAAFDAGSGRVALVCNHELAPDGMGPGSFARGSFDRELIYDTGRGHPLAGGTTTIVYEPGRGRVERHFLSLAGTELNCAGGPTPWGSWLSCEETVALPDGRHVRSHGWVFEVPAVATGPAAPVPLKAMGRFRHEAVAIDARTGIAYLTEDRPDGLFYRFLPKTPGRLADGGRLEALALKDRPRADTRNYPGSGETLPTGRPFAVQWIGLDDPEAPDDGLRRRGREAGAAIFARAEGICAGPGAFYFACTSGGAAGAGQIFRYRPAAGEGTPSEEVAPGTLELFVESTDRRALEHADNLVVSPWGDVMVCEDARRSCDLVGITPAGELYTFARNSYDDSELAGVCFAPDGRTLFVNLQERGLTLSITGPFPG